MFSVFSYVAQLNYIFFINCFRARGPKADGGFCRGTEKMPQNRTDTDVPGQPLTPPGPGPPDAPTLVPSSPVTLE